MGYFIRFYLYFVYGCPNIGPIIHKNKGCFFVSVRRGGIDN